MANIIWDNEPPKQPLIVWDKPVEPVKNIVWDKSEPITMQENTPTPIADAFSSMGNGISNFFTPTPQEDSGVMVAPPMLGITTTSDMNTPPQVEIPANSPRNFVPATQMDINLEAIKNFAPSFVQGAPTALGELGEGAANFAIKSAQDLGKLSGGGPNVATMDYLSEVAKQALANNTEDMRRYWEGKQIERPIGAEADVAKIGESNLTRQKVEEYIAKNPKLSDNAKEILRAKAQPETAMQSIEKTVANTPGAKGVIEDAAGLVEFATTAPADYYKIVRVALADAGLINANTSDAELKKEILDNPMGVFGRVAAKTAMVYGIGKQINKARTTTVEQTPAEALQSQVASKQGAQDVVKQSADFQAQNTRNAEYYKNTVKPNNQYETQQGQKAAAEAKANVEVPDTSNYFTEISDNGLVKKDEIVAFYKGRGETISREEAAKRRNLAYPELAQDMQKETALPRNPQATSRAFEQLPETPSQGVPQTTVEPPAVENIQEVIPNAPEAVTTPLATETVKTPKPLSQIFAEKKAQGLKGEELLKSVREEMATQGGTATAPAPKVGMLGTGTLQNIYEIGSKAVDTLFQKRNKAYSDTQNLQDQKYEKGRLIDKTLVDGKTIDTPYDGKIGMFGGGQIQNAYNWLTNRKNTTPPPGNISNTEMYKRNLASESAVEKTTGQIGDILKKFSPGKMRVVQEYVQDKWGPIRNRVEQGVIDAEARLAEAQKNPTASPALVKHLEKQYKKSVDEAVNLRKKIGDQDFIVSKLSAFDDEVRDVVGPLQEAGVNKTALSTYMESKRLINEIENKPDVAMNIDPKHFADAENFLDEVAKNPTFKAALDKGSAELGNIWNSTIVEGLRETGVIDDNLANLFKANQDYVPFKDLGHWFDQLAGDQTAGTSSGPKPKKLVGSDFLRENVVDTFIDRANQLIPWIEQQKMKNYFVDFVDTFNQKYTRELTPEEIKYGTSSDAAKNNVAELVPTDGKGDIVTYKNGKEQAWTITDKDVKRVLKDPYGFQKWIYSMEAFKKFNDYVDPIMQTTAITLNTAFSMVGNPTMDILSAMQLTPGDAGKFTKNLPGGLKSGVKAAIGYSDALTRELKKEGAILPEGHTMQGREERTMRSMATEELKKDFKKFFEYTPNGREILMDALKGVLGVFEVPLKAGELTTKLAAAKGELEKMGVSSVAELRRVHGETTVSNLIETVRDTGSPRFSRSGRLAPVMKFFDKFLPAGIQGEFTDAHNLWNTMKNKPMRFLTFVVPTASMILAQRAAYNGWLGKEERDKYVNAGVTDRTVKTSFLVDQGNGVFAKITKPRWTYWLDAAFSGGDPDKMKQSMSDFMAGAITNAARNAVNTVPSASPWFQTGMLWSQFAKGGQDIPENYAGYKIMNKNQWNARNIETLKGVLKETWNQWGGSIFRMNPDNLRDITNAEKERTKGEIPFLSPLRRKLVHLPTDNPSGLPTSNIRESMSQENAEAANQAQTLGAKLGVAKTPEEKKSILKEVANEVKQQPPEQKKKFVEEFKYQAKKTTTGERVKDKTSFVKLIANTSKKELPHLRAKLIKDYGFTDKEFVEMVREAYKK